jgi:hypothetical protein
LLCWLVGKIKNAVSKWNLFDPVHGADGWQISNIPILSRPIWLRWEMFDEIGMEAIIEKRESRLA